MSTLFEMEVNSTPPISLTVALQNDADKWGAMGVHFSAATDDWATPEDVFASLDAEFGFTLDVCASDSNAKCPRYYTKTEDGLRQSWTGETCWCNPPYGNEIARWVAKAADCMRRGVTTVLLLPARTETRWFHQYVIQASEVRFIRGRLKFGGAEANAPFPSMIVIFRGKEAHD